MPQFRGRPLDAEGHVGDLLIRNLTGTQSDQLDTLLDQRDHAPASVLAWVRQPPGKPRRRAFAAILERLAILRGNDLDSGLVAAIHPERLRRLSQEGARLTAQHLATLNSVRRRAVLVATAIETPARDRSKIGIPIESSNFIMARLRVDWSMSRARAAR